MIIFTNGCFDILHVGHIETLRYASRLSCRHGPTIDPDGEVIVGLNSDESVRRLKGFDRPINHQEDRKIVLEAIRYVSKVVIFDEDTPYELIKRVKPDIVVKGGDYKSFTSIVGSDIARVEIAPYIPGYSTTEIAKKL